MRIEIVNHFRWVLPSVSDTGECGPPLLEAAVNAINTKAQSAQGENPMRKFTTITAIVPLLVMVAMSMTSYSAHGQELPSRAFEIESGSVEMQGGLLGSTDEVMLFMTVANRTGKTIWTEVAFQVPESDKGLQEFVKIKSGRTHMYRWPVSNIVWDTEYPFTVSVFKDKKRKKPLGTEESFFFFEGDDDRGAFEELRSKLPPGAASVFNGFRELTTPSLSAEVSGTAAGSKLQADIIRRLFTEESKLHKECKHAVLKAEPYGANDPSLITAEMGEKAQELEGRLRSKGDMLVEKWLVESCNLINSYEVLLTRSPAGGTDIMVQKIVEAAKK